jgi:hypothetical protein
MGLVPSSIPDKYWSKKSAEGFGEGELVYLLYDSDWNWLFPVVEKIFQLKIKHTEVDGYIGKHRCRIEVYPRKFFENDYIYFNNSKIEAVYNACIEFIKWYNSQSV